MAYSDFDQDTLERVFNLEFIQKTELFKIQPVAASDHLKQTIERNLPLAAAINTEKARSELLIAPVLVEVKSDYPQISLFSGNEFTVDASQGLNGRCDFLISQSPDQLTIKAPIAVIFEAKREDLNAAIPQCAAAMFAAQLFNQRQANPISVIYGGITTGSVWRFLRLQSRTVTIGLNEVYLTPLEILLGHLTALLGLETLTAA